MLKRSLILTSFLLLLGSIQTVWAQPAFGPAIPFNQLQFNQISQPQFNFPAPIFQTNNIPNVQFENIRFPSFATPVVTPTSRESASVSGTSGRPQRSAITRSSSASTTFLETPPLVQASRNRYRTPSSTSRTVLLNPARQRVAQAAETGRGSEIRQIATRSPNRRLN
ncbi:MAG: hypothetical protein R3C11_17215 [Planctomycetaceae bacterium]